MVLEDEVREKVLHDSGRARDHRTRPITHLLDAAHIDGDRDLVVVEVLPDHGADAQINDRVALAVDDAIL